MVISEKQSHQKLHGAVEVEYGARSATHPKTERAHGGNKIKDT